MGHFGMRAHIGMDSKLKIVHSFAATPANVPIAVSCPTYCMATNRACGAMQRIAAKRQRFGFARQAQRISRIITRRAERALQNVSRKRIVRKRACVLGSNTRSTSSSASSDS